MDEVARICARLLREGAVLRAELRELDHPDVRPEVERRLASVGLVLATSAYSEHVGVRLSSEVAADPAFDAASNLGLRADACALLVILWARLVLQKRTAADTRELPGQGELLPEDRTAIARQFSPSVRLTTLFREFGKVIGSQTRMKALVTQLRRLGFLAGHGERIEAGPLLELGIDGERMVTFIRRQVLVDLVERKDEAGGQVEGADDASAQVLQVLRQQGGSAGMRDLEQVTGERRVRLRALLRELAASGRIRKVGERGQTRYLLVEG